MNKYFLEEGTVWIMLGGLATFLFGGILYPIFDSVYGIFALPGASLLLIVADITEYIMMPLGGLLFIGGLFMSSENNYFETRGISGKWRLERREREVLKYKRNKELLKTNEEWKRLQKERKYT